MQDEDWQSVRIRTVQIEHANLVILTSKGIPVYNNIGLIGY